VDDRAEVFGDWEDSINIISNSTTTLGIPPSFCCSEQRRRHSQATIGRVVRLLLLPVLRKRVLPLAAPRTATISIATTTTTTTTVVMVENGTEQNIDNRNETPTDNCGGNERSGRTTIEIAIAIMVPLRSRKAAAWRENSAIPWRSWADPFGGFFPRSLAFGLPFAIG